MNDARPGASAGEGDEVPKAGVDGAGAAEPSPESESVDPASGRDAQGVTHCDLCGAPMLEWHCRLVCTACGFQRDCSDP